jgi:hypothetical protein
MGSSSGVIRDGRVKEINDGSHACCPGKVAVRDEVQFRYEHLLGRKKTNEIGIVIRGQAR